MNTNHLVIVAIGSNLGDPITNVRHAMEHLEAFSDSPLLRSSLWRSTPVDCPPGSPLFLNAIVAFEPRPGDTPESVFARLQELERQFGREARKVRNEPRPLDLDLLTFGNLTRSTRELVLPHPRAHERRFVLQPLSEIAPELILPRQSKTVAALLAALPPDQAMVRI